MQSLIFVIFFFISWTVVNIKGKPLLQVDPSENAQPANSKEAEIHSPTILEIVNFSHNNESLKDSLTQNATALDFEILMKQLPSEKELLQDETSQTKNNEEKIRSKRCAGKKRYSGRFGAHHSHHSHAQNSHNFDAHHSHNFDVQHSGNSDAQHSGQSETKFTNINYGGTNTIFQGQHQHFNGDIHNNYGNLIHGTNSAERRPCTYNNCG